MEFFLKEGNFLRKRKIYSLKRGISSLKRGISFLEGEIYSLERVKVIFVMEVSIEIGLFGHPALEYSGLHRHEHRIGALMPDRTLHGVTSLKEV